MNPIPYRIADIQVTAFHCQQQMQNQPVNIQSSYSFQVSEDTSSFKCISTFGYFQEGQSLMELTLECVFLVESKAFAALKNDGKIELDVETLRYFATISVGTARGEIHARCEALESELATVVLPPINLTKIITHPAVFSL